MVRKNPKHKPDEAGISNDWSHVAAGPHGAEAAMVDVSSKPESRREATARAVVRFPPGILSELLAGGGPKGPALEVARTAAILAAKRTSELIPLCHGLSLDAVEIRFTALDERRLEVRCRSVSTGRTGVEMEALVGASLAALTIYDMSKARSHEIEIERVQLLEKRGGRSGHWIHPGSRES